MDRSLIALLAAVILVSGCTDFIQTDSSPEGVEPEPGAGLEVTELSISDETLRAGDGNLGQRAEVTLELTNHHSKAIEPDISVENAGQLKFVDRSNPCNQDTLAAVQEEIVDQMECTWTVQAPDRSTMGPFDEKPVSFSLVIGYDSQITNQEPLKVQFLDRSEITNSDPVERKFSNNEVQMTIRTDNPSPMSSSRNRFEIQLANAGSGDVKSSYDLSYQPDIMGDQCPRDDAEGRIGSEFSETCSFSVSSAATRNIFVSAAYKYEKQQNVAITLVR